MRYASGMENINNDTEKNPPSGATEVERLNNQITRQGHEITSLTQDLVRRDAEIARKDEQIKRLKTLLNHYGMDDGLIKIFLAI